VRSLAATHRSRACLRVAVLAPISWHLSPRHYGPGELFASLRTEGLVVRGHHVTLFATGDSQHGDPVCACRNCDPSLAPDGPRLGEHHLAVRFGDVEAVGYLDGEPIMNCFEIWAGTPGQAWRIGNPPHLCWCSGDVCVYIDVGNYSVGRIVRTAR
jgi:hypothetical protein